VTPYLLTLYVMVSLNFLLPRLMPGGPVEAQLTIGSPSYVYDSAAREALSAYYGLDRPLGAQYLTYLGGLARADLGLSTTTRTPVATLIADRLPWTLLLAGTGVGIATVVGFLAGAHAGWRREHWSDRTLVAAFVGLQNVPSFVLAALALLVFSVHLGWAPLGGARTPFVDLGPLALAADVALHLVLPACVLAAAVAAFQFLLVRAAVVTELGAEYMVLGKVKGLSRRQLKYRYAARNALLPLVGNTAVQLGAAVTATVFVERVFAYPGVGRLLFDAIAGRDYPVLQGCFLVITVLVLATNLAADIAYRFLDPRARP
jgi:peptide/nickel transport system permease protein